MRTMHTLPESHDHTRHVSCAEIFTALRTDMGILHTQHQLSRGIGGAFDYGAPLPVAKQHADVVADTTGIVNAWHAAQ